MTTLTDERILSLTAGPEADALVAEFVMGWVKDPLGWKTPFLYRHETRWRPSTDHNHCAEMLAAIPEEEREVFCYCLGDAVSLWSSVAASPLDKVKAALMVVGRRERA